MSESPSYRCSTCKSASKSPRNLVVLIDGTSNKPGDENTNVVKFYHAINESQNSSEVEQHKHYLEGIGAYEPDKSCWLNRKLKTVQSKLEQIHAGHADRNIKDAYRWLTEYYQEGDQIYLFGFSRGGFQVRALASMIHEVGLVKGKKRGPEAAYNYYQAIDPYNPETRKQATAFKQMYCWKDVRIHFVGVWDTVSSLGFVKKDVHITASSSVTNACHFRHALALDECRVKFMPEYFLEMNVHRSEVKSPRADVGDVKEVWFAGCHSDVGGTERPSLHQLSVYWGESDIVSRAVHAGNVPLLWMRREASNDGLVFRTPEFAWGPEDIEFGATNSMSSGWGIVEVLPVRHQVSFSGAGKHKRWFHWFRPRSVIPGQQIHPSVLSAYMYSPKATLRNSVCVPAVKENPSDGLWATGLQDEEATAWLSSLLSDQYKTLECLGKVLFLLDSRLGDGLIQSIPQPRWFEEDVSKRSNFAKFVLTVIYDVTSQFTVSEELLTSAKASLSDVLSNPDRWGSNRTLNTVRFLTRHKKLRQRFLDDKAVEALMLALEWIITHYVEDSLSLVTESICDVLHDDDLRDIAIQQLSARDEMLSVALEIKSPKPLVSLLKMIATLYQELSKTPRRSLGLTVCSASFYGGLECKIIELAKKGDSPVGPAAVEALIALTTPCLPSTSNKRHIKVTPDIHISNLLGYLCSTLPRLDAEGGSATSAENISVPPVLQLNYCGVLDEEVTGKLVSAIKSSDHHERTMATLTVVKLCGNEAIRKFCMEKNVLKIFVRQLENEKFSLLAAYAVNKCLKYKDMWSTSDFPRVTRLIVAMLDKGWFDDAVGQVEGCEILRGLMASGDLRKHANASSICTILMEKLEVGRRDEVRMSLVCLDVLEKEESLGLKPIIEQIVTDNVHRLREKNRKVQTKGVKVLAALAQTKAGERAIMPYMTEIVKMMLPRLHPVPRDQLRGPVAAVYDLCKNETLREQVRDSPEFRELKNYIRRGASR